MRRYWVLLGLSIQKQLEVRSNFLFERVQSIAILFSIYFLWSSLLQTDARLLDYSREQLLTYVFMMTFLRAWVLGTVSDRIPQEIAKGQLSDVLLRPISHMGYWATQDVANKSINLISAVVEVLIFVALTGAPFYFPGSWGQWGLFWISVFGGMVIYFQLSYLIGVIGFWTAQSWGPRFCFEVILEFCAGAYFPIDMLPDWAQRILFVLPFPYLVFYPISIYLGRVSGHEVLMCFVMQGAWILALGLAIKTLWARGLSVYAAEGR